MSNPTVNSVFEAFIEADKAMKELPAIREELAQTKVDQANLQQHANHLQEDLENWRAEAAALKASLAAKEAELAHATFRADAVEAKHRALRSILSSGDDLLVAVDGALTVNPSNEVFPPSDPYSPGPTGSQSSGSEPESSGQSENNPTPNEATTAGQSISTAQGNGDIVGQSDVDPTTTDSTGGTLPQSENPTSAPGPSSNPSVNAGESGMFIGEPASGVLLCESASPSPPLAFSGHPYTRKPDGMEWGYWIVNGGEAPPWYSPTDIERVKARYAEYAGHAKAAAE